VFEPPDLRQTRIDRAFRDRAPRIERIGGADQIVVEGDQILSGIGLIPTCSPPWTTRTASATARRFTGSRACPREGGDGLLPSDFFRRNVVLSFQEDAIGGPDQV
jgi:hypothetical protein